MINLDSKQDLKELQDFISMVLNEYKNNAIVKKKFHDDLLTLGMFKNILQDDESYDSMYNSFYMLNYSDNTQPSFLIQVFIESKNIALENNLDYKICRINDFQEVINNLIEAIYLLRCNELSTTNLEYEGIDRSKNTIKRFIELISECQLILKNKLNILGSLDKIDEEKRNLLSKIQYFININYPFSVPMFTLLNDLFKIYQINPTTQIVWLENMKNYDVEIRLNRKNYTKHYIELDSRKDEIINMVQFGFENIPNIYYDGPRKNELESIAKTIIECKDDTNAIPRYVGNFLFDGNLSLEDFNYIIMSVLKHYQDIMLSDVQDIKVLANYQDKELKKLLPKDFYYNLNIYEKIRNFQLEQLELYNNDLTKVEGEDNNYVLSFATSDNNTGKSYFESDLKFLPQDLYLIIKDMLISIKKSGSNSRYSMRTLLDCNGIKEIKNDQIRIFFDYGKNGEFIIIGVFQKKRDNDQNIIRNLRLRNRNIVIESPDYEEYLLNNLATTSHRGGRK